MKIPLSPRLAVCCGFVAPGERVADIGCDHGYLGIYLLKNGIASSVIAADVREAPLRSAMRNGEKYGVKDKMRFYLSDGVRNIPRDFDTLVCAGMGADTMISILEGAPWLKDSRYRLVLQCQSRRPQLRQYLSDNGWRIFEETVVQDGRFLYTVMEVIFQPGYILTPGGTYFPPALLENPGAETVECYHRVLRELENALKNPNCDAAIRQAYHELTALPAQAGLDFLKEELS